MKSRKTWIILAFALIVAIVGVIPVIAASTVTDSDWLAETPNPLVKCPGGSCDHSECDYVYSFAIVGDTQNLNYKDAQNFVAAQASNPSLTYAGYTQAYMRTLYNWILNKQNALNIQYVMGVGDITQSFNSSQTYYDEEWPLAKEAISLLDGKIGYSLVRGNHDISSGLNAQFGVGTTYYNTLDAISKTVDSEGRPMGGFRDATKIEDSYRKIVAGGNKYIIFTLEYYPTEETVAWMNNLLTENSDYTAIVTLHSFVNRDTTFVDLHETTTPEEDAQKDNWKETATGGMVSPRSLWERVLSKHANVQMVISGHIDEDNVLVNSMQGDNGNTVTFMLTDTQTIDSTTPVGIVTMLYFSADGKVAHVEHISTVRDAAGQPAYLRDVNQFTLDLDYKWTATKYGDVPTAEYNANTFHILLDDDGNPDNDSFYYGSYNTWAEVVNAIYPWTGIGSAEARSLKQYNILMSKDYTNSADAPNTLTNNNRGTISLDLDGHTLTNSGYLYRVYNKFDTYTPTIEIKNGKVIQKGTKGLAVLQLSTRANNTKLTVNLENLNVSYDGGTAYMVAYYNGYEGYKSTVDLNVTNCDIDTTGASGNVTLFNLADTFNNCDVNLTFSDVNVKGTTAANTVIYVKNEDTVNALPDASGNALTVSLTENVNPGGVYTGVGGGYYTFGAATAVDGRYVFSLEEAQLEKTPYGPLDATAYPASEYPFALFSYGDFVKAYSTYLAFLTDIPTSVKTESTLLVRNDFDTSTETKAGNLGKLTAPLTIDLNGKTVHRGGKHLLQMMGYGTDYSVTVKNGTITYANSPVAFNNNGASTYKETVTLKFEDVTFAPTTSKNLIVSYTDGTGAGLKANVTFDNCTFDLTKHTSTTVAVFSLIENGVNKNDISVTINGGLFKANTFNQIFATYSEARDDNATPDKIVFGKYNGNYTKFTATAASAAPEIEPVNTKGEKLAFDNIGTDSAPTYRLTEVTKYGLIPYKWESVTDYPFVLFKKGEDVASYATSSWKSVMGEAVKNDGCVILLRRNYDVSEGGYYVAEANAAITLDLGGFEFTNSGYILAYYGNTAANTTFTITVKNGTFNQKAKQPFINVDYSAAALYKTINLIFEDLTVKSTYTSTNWSILANYSNSKPKFNGKVSVTLTDCTVDFTGTTKNSNLIHAGTNAASASADFTITINGGKIIADNIANYNIYGIGEGDTVVFNKGSDDKYTILVTSTAPTVVLKTNGSANAYFKATDTTGEYVITYECVHSYTSSVTKPTCTDEGYTTHTCTKCGNSYVDTTVPENGHTYTDDLDTTCNVCGEPREITISTKYGTIPSKWTDATLYPFVLFVKGNDTAVFASANWKEMLTEATNNLKSDSAEATILLRADASEGSADHASGAIRGKLVVDLGGHTLTVNKFLFKLNKTGKFNTNIEVKDGNLSFAGTAYLIYFGSSANATNGAAGYQCNVTFSSVNIGYASGATSVSWIRNMKSAGGLVTIGNLKFVDCVLDFKTNAPAGAIVFAASNGDEHSHSTNIVIDGGEIIYPATASNLTLFTPKDSTTAPDTFKFDNSVSGKYTVASASAAPTGVFDTVSGAKALFKATDVAGKYVITLCTHSYDNACDTTCNDCGTERTITHDYTVTDYNTEQHWKKCSVCGTPDESTKADHEFDNACDTNCSCGYERTITHNYNVPENDETHHWNKCECGAIDEKVDHEYANNCDKTCECGYVRTAPHEFTDSYNRDNNYHWIFCIRCFDVKPGTKAEHSYDDNCDTDCYCGNERIAPHNYNTTYENDDEQHWIICADCETEQPGSREGHSYDNACDTTCACGYERTVTHDYSVTDYNTEQHWKKCSVCGTPDESTKADHEFDNACDTTCACGYERTVTHNYNILENDETHHWNKCECGATDEMIPHDYTETDHNDSYHWNKCSCGATDEEIEHFYDDVYDTDCDCGYDRGHQHVYDTLNFDGESHWYECSCGLVDEMTVEEHFYDDDCDDVCDCGNERTAPHNFGTELTYDDECHWIFCIYCRAADSETVSAHVYDDDCDAYCECGYERTAPHNYNSEYEADGEYHWIICADCEDEMPGSFDAHNFENSCDTDCKCGYVREITHTYAGDCDAVCDVCSAPRTPISGHVYEYSCDSVCNVCGETRTTVHTYTNVCDATCDVCFENRTPVLHTGGTATCTAKAVCSVCGAEYGEYAAHVYGSEWVSGSVRHWHECACGSKSDEADHVFGDWTEKDGTRIKSCECGYTVNDAGYKAEETMSTGATVTLYVLPAVAVIAIGFGTYWFVFRKKK